MRRDRMACCVTWKHGTRPRPIRRGIFFAVGERRSPFANRDQVGLARWDGPDSITPMLMPRPSDQRPGHFFCAPCVHRYVGMTHIQSENHSRTSYHPRRSQRRAAGAARSCRMRLMRPSKKRENSLGV